MAATLRNPVIARATSLEITRDDLDEATTGIKAQTQAIIPAQILEIQKQTLNQVSDVSITTSGCQIVKLLEEIPSKRWVILRTLRTSGSVRPGKKPPNLGRFIRMA